MPDPWGGDNMSEEYAGAVRSKTPLDVDLTHGVTHLPTLPKFINTVLESSIPSAHRVRPSDDCMKNAVHGFRDAVQRLYLGVCRVAGINVSGHEPAAECNKLAMSLAARIEHAWNRQDETRAAMQNEYDACVTRAGELARKLGLDRKEST